MEEFSFLKCSLIFTMSNIRKFFRHFCNILRTIFHALFEFSFYDLLIMKSWITIIITECKIRATYFWMNLKVSNLRVFVSNTNTDIKVYACHKAESTDYIITKRVWYFLFWCQIDLIIMFSCFPDSPIFPMVEVMQYWKILHIHTLKMS